MLDFWTVDRKDIGMFVTESELLFALFTFSNGHYTLQSTSLSEQAPFILVEL